MGGRQACEGVLMVDRVPPATRSRIMASVVGKSTKPERLVRSIAHAMGYRFRLHRSDLPGKPDIVFPKRKCVILVHGCFWHGHACKRDKMPKSNVAFWNDKIMKNQIRDVRVVAELEKLGWRVLILWECETKNLEVVKEKLISFLGAR